MTTPIALFDAADVALPEETSAASLDRHATAVRALTDSEALHAAVRRACGRIAPLWPLDSFVAVNPFLGLADQTFEQAGHTLRQVAGARLVMAPGYYLEQLDSGRITDGDVDQALADFARRNPGTPAPAADAAATRALLARAAGEDAAATGRALTYADAVDLTQGTRWAPFVVEEIAKWCGAYFDGGQSAWRMPWRDQPLYAAWREAARLDRTAEVMGLGGCRDVIARLPEEPAALVALAVARLGVPAEAVELYLHRALASIGGWSGHARYRSWMKELRGESDGALAGLLAIRLAWDLVLAECLDGDEARRAFAAALREPAQHSPAFLVAAVMQRAREFALQREFLAKLAAGTGTTAATRPAAQAVFCIDVRSEVYRRALESAAPEITTVGFAGFFGFAIEYVPIGRARGGLQCPVLLNPAQRVRETIQGASREEETSILSLRRLRRRVAKAWKSFRTSAVSCFAYVETAGLLFAPKLVSDSFALTRTVEHPATEGLDDAALARVAPEAVRREDDFVGRTGYDLDERIASAAGALGAMGLADGALARLVLLCGHGSTTVNNPYAAGLDCGACGGHTGEANARVAVAILNEPAVRAGLATQGITIPDDTWFLAGLHDTTTDDVRLYDTQAVPATHSGDLAQLRASLEQASLATRAERSALLAIDDTTPAALHSQIRLRSRDWAQVRPEWGLAGNAAFIAAPRRRTLGTDLGGRAFLHDYQLDKDPDRSILELIMTAPLVVASWINLQYYGSSVDNTAFGSGNKVLHNVVGTLGVLQGNGGDLQVGLPWQSVHDGKRLVHEPVRLSAFIEAPREELTAVLVKHPALRQLLDNGWLHLFAIEDDGRRYARYCGGLEWAVAAA